MEEEEDKNIKIEILCEYFNGFEGSCKYKDKCKFKHSNIISTKESCSNWINYNKCDYGQNCNYFHPQREIYSKEEGYIESIKELEHPLVGKKIDHNKITTKNTQKNPYGYIFKINY